MRKKKSIISIDKLTLCYRATDEVIRKLNEYDKLEDSDNSFTPDTASLKGNLPH